MADNEKKSLKEQIEEKIKEQEEKDKKNDKNLNNNPMNNLWGWFVACFILSFFINWFFLGGAFTVDTTNTVLTDTFVESLKETPYSTVQRDTVFRCTTYSPVFTKDGVKQYEVRFKDMNSDLYFSVVVPGQEVDVLNNIEEDAKYEGSISYLYAEKAFTEVTKDLEEDKVEGRILALLEGKSEYAKFGSVSDISFMYSSYLEDYNVETATAYLDEYIDKLVNPPVEENTNKVPLLNLTSQ